jgi:glucose-1-phosphate thymidylyltransferase
MPARTTTLPRISNPDPRIPKPVKVIIPLAGKGTRLRPHTHVTPKPLLRVADKPVMSYILDELRERGVHEAVFITGHLKEKVEEYVRAEYPEFTAHFVEQAVQNGTAGAVELAREHADEDLLIMFVDTLFDADLSLIDRLEPEAAGIIWVKEVEDYQRFGVVVSDEQGYMQRIVEKPSEPVSRRANIGLYYIRDHELLFRGIDHVMKSVPGGTGEFYLTDAFQYMIDQGGKLRVVDVEGWYDAGKPETLLETNLHLLSTSRGKSPPARDGVTIREPVHVADGVELEECEIGPNVTISAGSRVRGSRLRDTIVGRGATVAGCDLHDSLVGDEAVLEGVRGQVDVGDHSVVRAGA